MYITEVGIGTFEDCDLFISAQCQTDAEFDEKCVVNASIPVEEEGNYIDCNTPEQIEAKSTRCCDVEGAKGCCSDETPYVALMFLVTIIGMKLYAIK